MQNNAPAGIRTRVAQLGTVHDNPYTTGAHASTVGTTTFGWDRTPPASQHLIGIEPPSAPQPLVGIEPQDSVGSTPSAPQSLVGIETQDSVGSNPWDRNPRDWRNGDRSYPNGIETLDSAFAVDGKKRHQEDSNFRGRIPSRFLIYRLNHSAMVPAVEVLPGFEPGSPDSESEVLTSYTIRPRL